MSHAQLEAHHDGTISPPADADLLKLRKEFVAMPGLCLTTLQAARLFSVRKPEAGALLDKLVYERTAGAR